jgi:hypothetical protein
MQVCVLYLGYAREHDDYSRLLKLNVLNFDSL